MIGLEWCLPLLLDLARRTDVPVARVIEALTSGPARVIGLPRRGIAEGEPADLVLVDPDVEVELAPSTLRSKNQNSPFVGRRVRGRVTMTMVAGRAVFEQGAPT